MPHFGADGILKPEQIQQVADYVTTLFGKGEAGKDVSAGKQIFADNCAVCHGEAGQGTRELGAPKLASRVHLNAGDRASIVSQVTLPRMGVMPNWNTRLDEATVKSVALYVHSFGGGE
jgi:cytochrome c oxidase cbb3-type subunit 3